MNCNTQETFAKIYLRISKFILFADCFITHNDVRLVLQFCYNLG